MNMTSRLKKSKAIQRLKELHKTNANGDFLSARQEADDSEKDVVEKQHEISNILVLQSRHLNNKSSLDPMLMQMHAQYLSEQYQHLDDLLGIAQEKTKELDKTRHALAKCLTQEKVFEKLVDKLETERSKAIRKAEAMDNNSNKTSDVNLL